MGARCRIQLLGGLRVQRGDRVITRFRTQKTGALLALLAYRLEQVHPRGVPIVLLWAHSELRPDRPAAGLGPTGESWATSARVVEL